MGGMKKGLFFTLSVLLLATSFLYLVASASLYTNSLKTTAISLSTIGQLNVYTDSIVYNIRTLFSEFAEVTVDEDAGIVKISFEEDIPRLGSYSSDLIGFREFAETYGRFNTSINITEAQHPKLYLHPYDITVDHAVGRIEFDPEDNPGSAGKVTGYDVLFKIDERTPWLNWTEISELSSSDPDAVYFHIGVQGENGTVSETRYLNKYNYSELKLLDWDNESLVVIQLSPPAELIVNHNMEANMETVIYLNGSLENTSVELGRDIIQVGSGLTEPRRSCGVFVYEG